MQDAIVNDARAPTGEKKVFSVPDRGCISGCCQSDGNCLHLARLSCWHPHLRPWATATRRRRV